MKILALDISLNTGWACGDADNIVFGTRTFHSHSHDLAVLGRRFRAWICDMIREHQPNAIVIEQGFYKNGKPTTMLLWGMIWEAHRAAELRNIPRQEYSPRTLKKFITGSGNAKKPEVVEAIKNRGHNVKNDHEADAISLLLMHEEST